MSRDRAYAERLAENGRYYYRKVGHSPAFRLRQIVTPRFVFEVQKGWVLGEGSNHWRFSVMRREQTNL